MIQKIVNLGIRGSALGGKLFFIIFAGKFLPVEEMGLYGLTTSTLTLAIHLLGFDFYTYNTREIVGSKELERNNKLFNQLIFHFFIYTLALPLISIIFFVGILPTEVFLYFYLILLFDHLSQEVFRILVTLEESTKANVLLLLKSLWVYVIVIGWLVGIPFSFTDIVLFWASTSFVSLFFGVFILKRKKVSFYGCKFQKEWVISGVSVSAKFLLGSIAYRVMQFSDRYIIQFFHGLKETGAYSFFYSVANGLDIIIYTTVTMIALPKLIAVSKENSIQSREFKLIHKKFAREIIFVSLLSGGAIIFLFPQLVKLFSKEYYIEQISLFYWIVLSVLITSLNQIPHYKLYVAKKDNVIIRITLIGMFANILMNLLLIPTYGSYGAVFATCISFLFMAISKEYYSKETYIKDNEANFHKA